LISSLVALLIIFAAVLGSMTMVGILAYFLHRIRRLESADTREVAIEGMIDEMEAMRTEMLTAQNEMLALAERLDFTERLLENPDDPTDAER